MSADVDAAFADLLEELISCKEQLAEEVKAAVLDSRYDEAREMILRADQLATIIGEVGDAQKRWRKPAHGDLPEGPDSGPEGDTGGDERPAWEQYRECVLRVLVSFGGAAAREEALSRVEREAKAELLRGAHRKDHQWRPWAEQAYDEMAGEGLVLGRADGDTWTITEAGRRWLAEHARESRDEL
jgi:hypothetical protein